MEKKVNKNLNIPNALSFFRMLLIPVFIVFYMMADKTDYIYYVYAASALILSGLTDLFDGVIARKFNQITELGKILDPIADKLTQMAVVICVAIKLNNIEITLALTLFVLKEIAMLIGGYIILKNNIIIQPSQWYGKVATAVFYIVMAAIALFDLGTKTSFILILVAAAFMLFAFFQYLRDYFRMMATKKENSN